MVSCLFSWHQQSRILSLRIIFTSISGWIIWNCCFYRLKTAEYWQFYVTQPIHLAKWKKFPTWLFHAIIFCLLFCCCCLDLTRSWKSIIFSFNESIPLTKYQNLYTNFFLHVIGNQRKEILNWSSRILFLT